MNLFHYQTMSCSGRCDTCDSKNAKTPVMCARTRTREGGGYSYINITEKRSEKSFDTSNEQ